MKKLFFLFFGFLFLFPLALDTKAECVKVASNQTACTGVQKKACSQNTPTAGNIQRWCCDTEADCEKAKSGVQQEIKSNSSVCDHVNNPEFNSLRPYPGESCLASTANEATFCGNDLTIKETIKEPYPGGDGNCTTSGGKVTCTYNVEVPAHEISIDLSGAELPIMGNTEDVSNSKNTTGTLSNSEKMNGYVSWYLNGVMNRAEDGSTENNQFNAVNFSGPIQKLYPDDLLNAQRIKTVNNAKKTNHNQIVACATTGLPITDYLNIGHLKATECYSGGGSDAQGKIFRLKSEPSPLLDNVPLLSSVFDVFDHNSYGWDDVISWLRTITNIFPGGTKFILDNLLNLFPESIVTNIIQGSIDKYISTAWNKATPPLPWDDGTGKPFPSEVLYRKAYYEWHGKTCVIIPLVDHLVCLENFLIPNMYADLFPYVPLSTTEDVN
jgi:hypothetical protein